MQKSQFVRDLKDKDAVDTVFLVKHAAVLVGKNGKSYMNLVFMDKSGEVEARLWDDVSHYAGQVVRDAIVQVRGKCQLYQGRRQLVVSDMQLRREDEVELKDLLTEGKVDVELKWQELNALIASMKDPYYQALAQKILLENPDVVEKIKRAPAAKSMHHAYPGGMIEHVVSVTQLLDQVGRHYPFVDRDLLLLGGFFHDICKLWEMSYEKVTDYTMVGRLVGHLVMGVELVTEAVAKLNSEPGRLPGIFPEEKVLLVKHVILAHHGKLEYGSPKEPQVLEALIVHMIDDLDSKVNAIQGFIEADQTPGQWTALNRNFERYFFKSNPQP
jgi:3'-5' exoribonuclease